MNEILWTKQGENDFFQIYSYLNKIDPIFGEVFFENVIEKIKLLENLPYIGRIVPELNKNRIRELLLNKYRIFYFIKSEKTIEIQAIIHMKRNINK